jgi:hypothetical protein
MRGTGQNISIKIRIRQNNCGSESDKNEFGSTILCPVFYFKLKFEEEKTLIKGMMHWNLSPASRDVNHTIKRSQKYLPNEI